MIINKHFRQHVLDNIESEENLRNVVMSYGGTDEDAEAAINEAKGLSETTGLTYIEACCEIINEKRDEYRKLYIKESEQIKKMIIDNLSLTKVQKLKLKINDVWFRIKSKISPYWWMRYK